MLKTGVGDDSTELGPLCHGPRCRQQDVRIGRPPGGATGAFHVEEQVVGGEHPGHPHLLPAADLSCQFRHTCDARDPITAQSSIASTIGDDGLARSRPAECQVV